MEPGLPLPEGALVEVGGDDVGGLGAQDRGQVAAPVGEGGVGQDQAPRDGQGGDVVEHVRAGAGEGGRGDPGLVQGGCEVGLAPGQVVGDHLDVAQGGPGGLEGERGGHVGHDPYPELRLVHRAVVVPAADVDRQRPRRDHLARRGQAVGEGRGGQQPGAGEVGQVGAGEVGVEARPQAGYPAVGDVHAPGQAQLGQGRELGDPRRLAGHHLDVGLGVGPPQRVGQHPQVQVVAAVGGRVGVEDVARPPAHQTAQPPPQIAHVVPPCRVPLPARPGRSWV